MDSLALVLNLEDLMGLFATEERNRPGFQAGSRSPM